MVHLLKQREERGELKIMRSLNARVKLGEDEFSKYLSLEKGFTGEKNFDELTGKLTGDWLILNDLPIQYQGTKIQIDSLLLSQFNLYQFEVKNFEGDYYLDG